METTPETAPEPLQERLAREVPDAEPDIRREAGRLVDNGAVLDEEKDLVADAAEDELEGRSAEEAAMRIEDAPEGLTDGPDSYLENDPGS